MCVATTDPFVREIRYFDAADFEIKSGNVFLTFKCKVGDEMIVIDRFVTTRELFDAMRLKVKQAIDGESDPPTGSNVIELVR